MIELTRLWNARHGGVYVPVSKETQPNPYLDVPNRDIATQDGLRFTMVNPAFMTRQLAALTEQDGILFHITSLKPIRSENRADAWESHALRKFENGLDEVAERVTIEGQDLFRYMAPLITKQPCMKCHEAQGYQVGDIRGGISVTLNAQQVFGGDAERLYQATVQHALIYLLVSGLLLFFLEQIRRNWLALKCVEGNQQAIIEERTEELQMTNQCLVRENADRQEAENRYRAVTEAAFDAIISADHVGNVLFWNLGAERLFGYGAEEMIGKPLTLLMPERYREAHRKGLEELLEGNAHKLKGNTVELEGLHRDGHEFPLELSIGSWFHDEKPFYSAVVRDITERRLVEAQAREALEELSDKKVRLDYLAHHDPLTDLPNRLLLIDRLQQSIFKAQRARAELAVLFLDLDRFKQINDSLGHTVGDELLKEVAYRLQDSVRADDTVARLGGDEFTIILNTLNQSRDSGLVAQKLIDTFKEPFNIQGHQLYLTLSIGISLYPQDGVLAETLLRNADTAMYKAKHDGRNTFQFYTEDMTAIAYERVLMEADLRKALENGDFVVHYQPQFDIETHSLVCAEALVRWQHVNGTLIPPDKFIPVAEETGMIQQLGEWVLRESCRQMKVWQQAGLAPGTMKISVNLSVKQLQQQDLVERILRILQETSMEASTLEMEITESFIMQHPEQSAETFRQLRGFGIELAVDDFGTGYSSLSYLKKLPITKLKIDRSFVRDIPDDVNDEAIAKAVIALGKSLQLKVVAEGVETQEQHCFLCKEGCDYVQGYLHSRPLPATDFETYMKALKSTGGISELEC